MFVVHGWYLLLICSSQMFVCDIAAWYLYLKIPFNPYMLSQTWFQRLNEFCIVIFSFCAHCVIFHLKWIKKYSLNHIIYKSLVQSKKGFSVCTRWYIYIYISRSFEILTILPGISMNIKPSFISCSGNNLMISN